MKLLVANRGEIAVRILRAAAEVGLRTVAVAPADDEGRHLPLADEQVTLPGSGAAPYLDAELLVRAAVDHDCGLLHPGYGFLSERASFAEACASAGVRFVGPDPATLELAGDKVRSREVAAVAGLTVAEGTGPVRSVEQITAFLATLRGAPAMLKATAGGGGRGTRRVAAGDDLAAALERCSSEAERAFGDPTVHLERLMPSVRHVEVQLLGDGTDLVAVGDRDCSLQRGRQKLVEVAPAPGLSRAARTAIAEEAVAFGRAARVSSLATVEFLVSGTGEERTFLECNPRLQVEHAVTEAVTGLDLVAAQLRVALGETLADLGLLAAPAPRGTAIEVRINAETLDADGIRPDAGRLTRFELPTGPHLRVETAAHPGYEVDPRFDALLVKVVVDGPDLATALRRAERALGELHVEGVDTGAAVLRAALARPDVGDWRVDTTWFEDHLRELAEAAGAERAASSADGRGTPPDPAAAAGGTDEVADAVRAPSRATVVAVRVAEGEVVGAGQELVVLEAMKMQRPVVAPHGGTVGSVLVAVGEVVATGAALLVLPPGGDAAEGQADEVEIDPDHVRGDLRRLHEAIAPTLDEHRPEAVEKRRARGRRTARENLADLVDEGSFLEYGQLAVAGQRRVRSLEELVEATPADGIVTGTASLGAPRIGADSARVAVLAYDYTVLAGTQGLVGHHKTDRILELAHAQRLPVVFFTEGGGGRPGDVDHLDVSFSGLDLDTFATFAAIGTVAPRVAVNAGYGFAGNALLFGCADVRIATRGSSLGLAGPVMIEAAGLGACDPNDVGPAELLAELGVVDVLAEDERHATALARAAVEHLRGDRLAGEAPDQRRLRHVVPEDRKRAYGVRDVVQVLADEGSILELGATHAPGMVTAHVRIEGRPWGLIANDPLHLGGAIDAAGAAKAARFLRHCERFGLPVVSLCDTPGFMVGPDSEREGAAGAAADLVEAGAGLTVPLVLVCLRKGYGIGAMAMAGGSFRRPAATVSWPGGEFGPMSLEGIARIVSKAELEAETDPAARAAMLAERTAGLQELGGAIAVARLLEIDAVIDPADTRRWLAGAIAGAGPSTR